METESQKNQRTLYEIATKHMGITPEMSEDEKYAVAGRNRVGYYETIEVINKRIFTPGILAAMLRALEEKTFHFPRESKKNTRVKKHRKRGKDTKKWLIPRMTKMFDESRRIVTLHHHEPDFEPIVLFDFLVHKNIISKIGCDGISFKSLDLVADSLRIKEYYYTCLNMDDDCEFDDYLEELSKVKLTIGEFVTDEDLYGLSEDDLPEFSLLMEDVALVARIKAKLEENPNYTLTIDEYEFGEFLSMDLDSELTKSKLLAYNLYSIDKMKDTYKYCNKDIIFQ